MKTNLVTLKNNLKTLFIESPGTGAGSVQIWFRAGSALENKSNEGIAHFLEHMFFKGTKKKTWQCHRSRSRKLWRRAQCLHFF